MPITPLPTPPQPTDTTAQFNTRAFAFVAALVQFVTEANAQAVQVNSDSASASLSKIDALAAAAAAAAVAGATRWASGASYAEGAVVWSPLTLLAYRRRSSGAGTTDPSTDGTNWTQIAGTGDVSLVGVQTLTNKTISAGMFIGASTFGGAIIANANAYQVPFALTDGATITPNFSVDNNFTVTLAGNRTLANPTNVNAGQSGVIFITQDATGSRTLAFGSNWRFPNNVAPTLTTTANAVDALVYTARSATAISAVLITNV